ncbi:MAG: aromatic ring-hydroxylating dioxygenase subunit alpha, partial [Myxococcota bacterium]
MLHKQWYYVCTSPELSSKQRKTFKVLGEPLLCFRNTQGHPVVLEDRCPHRNVPLSMGTLRKGCITCPYHGWTFNGEGTCVHIPSLAEEDRIPNTAKVTSYPVREQNNMIWMFFGSPKDAQATSPPLVPEMDTWPFVAKEHIFEADIEAAAESLIDPYHIAFTHSNSIGTLLGAIEDKDQNPNFNIQVVDDGLIGEFQRDNNASFFEKMYFGNTPTVHVKYRFFYPNLSRLEIAFPRRTLLILEHMMKVDET